MEPQFALLISDCFYTCRSCRYIFGSFLRILSFLSPPVAYNHVFCYDTAQSNCCNTLLFADERDLQIIGYTKKTYCFGDATEKDLMKKRIISNFSNKNEELELEEQRSSKPKPSITGAARAKKKKK